MDTLHTVGRVWGMVQCLLFKLSALNRSWELGANPLLCRYAQWMTMAQCAKVFIGFPWGRTVVVSRDCGSCPHWPGMDWTKPIAWREGLFNPLYIFFFGFGACDFPVPSEKLGKCEWDSFPTYWNIFVQNLTCIEWGWHLAYHLKKLLWKVLNLCHDEVHFFRKGACRCWQVLWLCHFRKKGQHAWIPWLAWMVGQVGTVVAPVHWVDSTIIWRFPTMGVPQNWCFYNGTSESD